MHIGRTAHAQTGPGACCLPDGTCVRVAPSTCEVLGGVFMGGGTYCSEVSCPQPSGACCLADGSCSLQTQSACSAAGGTWSGPGVSCASANCPQPAGACCFADGSCSFVTGTSCASGGGTWSGAGVSCASANCPQPAGACCFANGSCSFVTQASCATAGGAWSGANVSCASADCPQPAGACCFPDGSCADTQQLLCIAAGGTWHESGSSCSEVACQAPPVPSGACCLSDGSCAVMDEERCDDFGGLWHGAFTICDETVCPQPTGACCFDDGSCGMMTQSVCASAGGHSWRQNVMCEERACPQPPEPVVCCMPDGSCLILQESLCAEYGGVIIEKGDTCDGVDCNGLPRDPPPLPDQPPRRASSGIKGSVLLLPAFEVRWNRDGYVVRDTFISITNDFPDTVDVLLYFVNGDEPVYTSGGALKHPGWNFVDNQIRLTANEPTFWSVATGLPKGVSPIAVLDPGTGGGAPPGRPDPMVSGETMLRGYIVAIAVHPEGHMIRFNHLSAVVTSVDYDRKSAYEYSALSFPVVDSAVAHGEEVGVPGDIRLDGDDYAFGYELLLMNFQAVGSSAFSGSEMVTSNGRMIVMPIDLDLRFGGEPPPRTYLKLDVWNENEVKFSGMGRCVICWNSTLLSAYGVPNHFLVTNLQTDAGKARMSGIASAACVQSQARSISGVAIRYLEIESRGGATTASLLTGMGMQAARVRFDPLLPPPEAPQVPESPSRQ